MKVTNASGSRVEIDVSNMGRATRAEARARDRVQTQMDRVIATLQRARDELDEPAPRDGGPGSSSTDRVAVLGQAWSELMHRMAVHARTEGGAVALELDAEFNLDEVVLP